jgi:hypothetical protein
MNSRRDEDAAVEESQAMEVDEAADYDSTFGGDRYAL